jgi:hypothetical protein
VSFIFLVSLFISFVMAGLVPAIHVLLAATDQDVDARHKAGHDDSASGRSPNFTPR